MLFRSVDATGPSSKRATVAALFDAGLPGSHTLLGDVTLSGAFNVTASGLGTFSVSATTVTLAGLVQIQLPLGNTATTGQPLVLASAGTSGLVAWADLGEPFVSTSIVTLTGSRAITDADHGDTLVYSGSTTATVTFPDTLRNDFWCRIVQAGTGKVTCAASGSATMNGPQGQLSTGHQWATIEVRAWSKIGRAHV